MSINLNRPQFSAMLRATFNVVATFGSLGRVGGNLNPSLQYNQSALFTNAVFDGRNFDSPSGPTPLDAGGWPSAGGWQMVISALVNATNTVNQPHLRTGQLTLATYTNCLFKTPSGSPAVLSCTGGTITSVNQQSDDGTTKTYTFTLTPTADSNVVISGTQAISFMYVPWDGSTAYNVLLPMFNSTILAYYAQFATLRLMDFCNTLDPSGGLSGIGKLGEKTWSDPVTGRVPNKTVLNQPYSWETIFAFAKAVDAYTNGATKIWINLPAFCDAGYATGCATLAASLGVPVLFVEYGNEPWNSAGYYFSNEYLYYGVKECQNINDYANGTTVIGISGVNSAALISTVTSDASKNVTVTLNVAISSYPNLIAGAKISGTIFNGSNITTFNPSAAVIASASGNSFTYPTTTAPISSSLSNISAMQIVIAEPIQISTVTSDGASPPNVTVTLNVPLSYYPFAITAGVTKMVANAQAASTWNAGTLATPVVVSSVTSNSFTYPSAAAPANSTLATGKNFSCWFGQVASSGVGLDSDLIKCSNNFNCFNLSGAYYVRQLKRSSDAWFAVRPNDKYILGLQTYGSGNPGNQFQKPFHYDVGTYFGNLSGSRPNLTWLYGAATAPYCSAGALTTTDAAFAAFTAAMPVVGIKIDSHVYWARFYGLVPMAYEWGSDTSTTAVLQIDINSDPRIQGMVKTLGDRILQAGFQLTNYFLVTPGAYQQTAVGSGWPSQQTITDTFTNYKTLALLQLQAEAENYSNLNGTCPCTFLPGNSKMSNPSPLGTVNLSNPAAPTGIYYWASSGTRDMSWLGAANAAGTFVFTATGTDSALNTQLTVYVDGVVQGAVTLPQGGAGSSNSSTPAVSTTVLVSVPKGAFILKVAVLAGGTSPGITQLALA